MEPDPVEPVSEEPPAPAEPPASEAPAPEPPAPLPTVVPPPPEPSPGEEADTEEPKPKPKPKEPKVITKVVRVPEPPAMTPHETFRMAMEALSHMARADKQSRQAKYDALVSRMVR